MANSKWMRDDGKKSQKTFDFSNLKRFGDHNNEQEKNQKFTKAGKIDEREKEKKIALKIKSRINVIN